MSKSLPFGIDKRQSHVTGSKQVKVKKVEIVHHGTTRRTSTKASSQFFHLCTRGSRRTRNSNAKERNGGRLRYDERCGKKTTIGQQETKQKGHRLHLQEKFLFPRKYFIPSRWFYDHVSVGRNKPLVHLVSNQPLRANPSCLPFLLKQEIIHDRHLSATGPTWYEDCERQKNAAII